MKKGLIVFGCVLLLGGPLQGIAVVETPKEDEVIAATEVSAVATSSTTTATTVNSSEPRAEEKSIEPEVPGSSETITSSSLETTSSVSQVPNSPAATLKAGLFKEQIGKMSSFTESALKKQGVVSLETLVTEAIAQLAAEFNLTESEVINSLASEWGIDPAANVKELVYLEGGRQLLVSFCEGTADYILAYYQAVYTEASLAVLQKKVSLARDYIGNERMTFQGLDGHFIGVQVALNNLEKKADFSLETNKLSELLETISVSGVENKKELYIDETYERFDYFMGAAQNLLRLIEEGETYSQKEVDDSEKLLQVAYEGLIFKTTTVHVVEKLDLLITTTSVAFPILTEKQGTEISVKVYGDTGIFETVGNQRFVVYVNGQPIYEDFFYGEPILLEKDWLNSAITEWRLETILAGYNLPELKEITRDYQLTLTDKRQLQTQEVIIPRDALDKTVTLTGGIFGENTILVNYDQVEELVLLDYFGTVELTDNQAVEPIESRVVSLGEPTLIWLTKEGKDEVIQLIVKLAEEPIGGKPTPPAVIPPTPQPVKTTQEQPTLVLTTKKPANVKKSHDLPQMNEVTPLSTFLTSVGQGLLVIFVWSRIRKKQN